MLTAHQRIQIARHLPEVQETIVIQQPDPIFMTVVRLRLVDGSEIAISGHPPSNAGRYRPAFGDYSDRVDTVQIPPEMRERIKVVFGALKYLGDA